MKFKIRKRDIAKAGIEIVIASGVAIVATNAVSQVIPRDLGTLKGLTVKVATYSVVGLVSASATNHITGIMDTFFDGIDQGRAMRQMHEYSKHDAAQTMAMYDSSPDVPPTEGVDEGEH